MMKKAHLWGAVWLCVLGLWVSPVVHGQEMVWLAERNTRLVLPSGSFFGQWNPPPSPPWTGFNFGGITTVGTEIWLGFNNSSTVLRLDFSGNVLGSVPAFTTEATGDMTTVGNEVWWGSANSSTILRLDFAGNVVGSADDADGLRGNTGGMAAVRNEVWVGPGLGYGVVIGYIFRYDLDGNWLGSLSDPFPGWIAPPVAFKETDAMTRVGDEVWWVEVPPTPFSQVADIYRMDLSGNLLGSFCVPAPGGCSAATTFRGMTVTPIPEPGNAVLFGVGLAVIGVILRRRLGA